jgi:hypothetical protein
LYLCQLLGFGLLPATGRAPPKTLPMLGDNLPVRKPFKMAGK